MPKLHHLLIAALTCIASIPADAQLVADPAKSCPQCAAWNVPQRPFRIFGNTYYVGTAELSAILVSGSDGLILLDAALPQSVPLIVDSIRELGFDPADIRLIVNSHTHFDHAGGIAALQRATHADVAASERAAERYAPANRTRTIHNSRSPTTAFRPSGTSASSATTKP